MEKMLALLFKLINLIIILELINCIGTNSLNQFTCQGDTYSSALSACPDLGTQKMSSGGNVTVFVRYANNLPNRDFTGPAAGVSDPYVRFTYGSFVRETKNVRNSLNPVWNEYVNLGVLGSATAIKLEIWDKDTGMEFSDDLIVQGTIRVPFCSTLNANISVVDCGQPFGCSSDDSLWNMPSRQLCHESGYFSFVNGQFCDKSGICLFLDFYIVPFTMGVELQYKNEIKNTPQLSVAGPPVSSGAIWTLNNGFPFLDNSAIFLDMNAVGSSSMKGALMFRMDNAEKNKGVAGAIKFYGSINLPAYIYVCRYVDDDKGLGVPNWLLTDFKSDNTSVNRLVIAGTDNKFQCYYNFFSGTLKNKWGGVIEGAIPFKSNTVAGYDIDASPTDYTYNYIIIAIPHTVVPREDQVSMEYDMVLFVGFLFSYGLIWFIFTYCIGCFLQKIDYRIDRVSHFLATRVLTGDDKSLIASLFIKYKQTPSNIEFRAHLFHVRNIIMFIFSIPFWLLVSWGVSCSVIVQPVGLGYAVMFIGLSAMCLTFGMKLWETSSWRFSAIAFSAIGMSIMFFLCFLLSVLFADPYVIQIGQKINFSALSIVFGTINVIPLILLVFYRDRSQQRKLAIVMNKMIDAVYFFKRKDPKSKEKVKENLNTNKLLHAILGETYTINPNIPVFKFSGILQEISPSALKVDSDETKKIKSNSHELEVVDTSLDIFKARLYYFSVASLVIYFIIAAIRTQYASLAFLNILTLLFLDFIHICLSRGDITWSPGFIVAVLVLGRVLIMSSPSSVWILNYSACYMAYALLLTNEMVNTYLPTLSVTQAGRMVFAGEDIHAKTSLDIAGTSFFCLGFLTFAFAAILFVASIGSADLPVPYLSVFGDKVNWRSIVFGLSALLFTIVISLIFVTFRAFYLERYGLLRGWAKEGYLYSKSINVPIMLAICTEISIVASGLMIFGVTNSSPVLISTIFFPLIFVSFSYSFQTWAKNDYDLIFWPPKEVQMTEEKKNASDLDVAFKMIEDLFGNENDMEVEDLENPETELEKEMSLKASKKKTLKGFKLPALKATDNNVDADIKMPPLPLKSVLRRKRQNLGIKTKVPLIKDLKSRDGADNDKFGDDNDIIDLDDPWAQFENDGNEKKKKVATGVMTAQRTPFLQNPYLIMLISCFSTGFKFLGTYLGKCFKYFKKNSSKVYVVKSGDGDIENGEGKEDNENEDLKSAIFDKHHIYQLSFFDATIGGHLSRNDYIILGSWYGGMLLILLYGSILSFFVNPSWIGFVIWYASSAFICTMVPIFKYFMTYSFDETMQTMIRYNLVVHFLFCLLFFLIDMNSDIGLVGSLWIFDYFLYYPLIIYIVFESYRWYDNGCRYKPLTIDVVGNVGTMYGMLNYIQSFPFILCAMIILNWQFYVFIDNLTGQIFTLVIIIACIMYIYLRDWATNNYYLSSELIILADIMINLTLFITFCIALFGSKVYDVIFAFSVFSFVYAFKSLIRAATRIFLFHANNRFLFFAPYIMPVYIYDTTNQDLMDETPLVKDILRVVASFVLWGCLLAIFYSPIDVGVSIASCTLLFLISLLAICMSYIPEQLAKCAPLLTLDGIVEVAGVAKEKFFSRKLPLNLEIEGEWEVALPDDPETEEKAKPSLLKQQERASLSLAIDIISDTRSLKYVREEPAVTEDVASDKIESKEEDEYELPWRQKMWLNFKTSISTNIKKLFEYLPLNKKEGWSKHSEALFSFSDALAEAIITSKGSFGLFGCEGIFYKTFQYFKNTEKYKYLSPKFFDNYDKEGNNIKTVQLSEGLDTREILTKIIEYDKALDYTFKEEARCAIHFILMMIMDSEAKLEREKVLFQRFLRENRFKLASNGISPPHEIFSSESYASTDIPLVAVWLSTLSPDERDRFHVLKATFTAEQKIKDDKVDEADYDFFNQSKLLEAERLKRDYEQGEIFDRYVYMKKEERVLEFSNTLVGLEKVRFQARKDLWLSDPNVYVDMKEIDLHKRFKESCMVEKDEVKEYVHNTLTDIEGGQRDTRLGEYGRTYQFVDSSFPPNDITIGSYDLNKMVLGWRCAPGVSDNVQLFDGGTHPDDILEGIFKDTWLVSALSMLVAAGDFGNGLINELVQKLFLGHLSNDGEMTLHTEVGAYCIQIYRNGEFVPIIVDDLLPMRNKDFWTNDNRGMACAHNRECKGLWVALIEKAFAKYFGSFTVLEKGYIHHALRDLTGFDSEWVPLAAASRGFGKQTLWENLLRYKNNGYILGAGTGDSELVDKDIQDAGIVFNSEYTIYDVLSVEGLRLLRVRNPPGDHDEWRGDYSDNSSLWTKRLKGKVSYSNADDNTFYISFDDFCNVFRNLYVCKYYNPNRWIEIYLTGIWKKADVTEIEKIDLMNQFMKEQDSNIVIDVEGQNKRKAKARVDCAGGLPTRHNPSCILENNPFYSLRIYRPTDLRIAVNQFDAKGNKSNFVVQPFSIFLIKNPQSHTPVRLEKLNKEDVVAFTGPPQKEKLQYLYVNSLSPGLYVVLVACYVSGMEGRFTISLLSNYKTDFSLLWPPMWIMKGEKTGIPEEYRRPATQSNAVEATMGESTSYVRSQFKSLFGGGEEFEDNDGENLNEEEGNVEKTV